ncbi:MAG TPA: arsenosugar biosynthesis radical SAM (seleno)protein ArsS [Candidatus Polarisedimenticolaceae bacterium]|nr:arsenosugar biosynthesis radical SAM (seleno)protein ArsS [Candidatus Polarisedimenticolaceae bacterium]
MTSLLQIGHPLASPAAQLDMLERTGAPAFDDVLSRHSLAALESGPRIEVLQVNVGKLCNQTCAHCHVDAGPDRKEIMTREVAQQVIELLRRHPIPTLDITGGAPELNPNFRYLVERARELGRQVIDRCNLTVLAIRGQHDLPRFLAAHAVEVIASLPSFRRAGTDAQRGDGVFAKSIDGLRKLNAVGYGRGGGLRLTLVHNPVGAFLPGGQSSLEREYKRALERDHGVVFDTLYTITNMPISRFLEFLDRSGNLDRYMKLLVDSFNPRAVGAVMCRSYISIGWDGRLYDCDFNQMLALPVDHGAPATLGALLASGDLSRRVRTERHCFGCTAGHGSSCAGAVSG